MQIIELPQRPEDWDEKIQQFETKTLFHESVWLDHTRSAHPQTTVDYFQITEGSATLGYFCAFKARKALLYVYGSPLPGAGTHLGPIVNRDVDQSELLRLLINVCREKRIAHLELSNEWLSPPLMTAHGFSIHCNSMHAVSLSDSRDHIWARLKSECRTRIRKAQKNGLVAEIASDPAIVDHFYRYFTQALARKGVAPPYSIDRARSLLKHLLPTDRVFPVWVRYQDRVIGAAFFPHDERCMYYWDGASDPKTLHLCPNDLLIWTAMDIGISRGIPLFINNVGGAPPVVEMTPGGSFTRFVTKFGGFALPYRSYRKSFFPGLETARRVYNFCDVQKRRIAGAFIPRPARPHRDD